MPQEPTVATPSKAYEIMAGRLDVIETLLAGTEAMRDAGETYLPRYDQESQNSYRNRQDRAVLFNYFGRSADALSGRPFREPVKVANASPQFDRIKEDIDLAGKNLTSFCREVFRSGLERGLVHVLVDFPQAPAGETVAQARRAARRPYFKKLDAGEVIAARSSIVNGQEVLNHVRIREVVVEHEGFGEVFIEQIRVIEPSFWQVWRKTKSSKDGQEEWAVVEEGVNTLGEIPLVTYYAGEREALHLARPPLMDLAHLNVQHWQSYSDQIHVLTVARFPILAASGVEDSDTLEIGPNKWLKMERSDGRIYYVEHSGNAINAGRQDLIDLEGRMAVAGIDLLVRRTSDRTTATSKAIDASQSGSMLQAMATDFSDPISKAARLAERWMDVADSQTTITVNSDFELALKDQTDMEALKTAWAGGVLSDESFLEELMRRNILLETFDLELNRRRLEAKSLENDPTREPPDLP